MDKIKVLLVHKNMCIRSYKIAYCLAKRKDIDLWLAIGLNVSGCNLDNITSKRYDLHTNKIEHIIKRNKPDIVHVHNTPNTDTLKVLDMKDYPVIHDSHDIIGAYKNQNPNYINPEEKRIWNNSKIGIIVVSTAMKDLAMNMYPNFNYDNCITIRSLLPEDWIPKITEEESIKNRINIVYEGSFYNKWFTKEFIKDLQYINDKKINTYIISANILELIEDSFKDLVNIHYGGFYRPENILYELSRYHYGLLHTIPLNKNYNISVPNKLFDYIASGIPVLTNSEQPDFKYIDSKTKSIIYYSEIEDINFKDLKDEYDELRKTALENRFILNLDNEIPKLIRFYKKIINQW